jgi:hypothetical protein
VPPRISEHAALETLRTDLRGPTAHDRQHRLRGDVATHRRDRRDLEQWEYEITSGSRVRYVIDDQARTAWQIYASPRHPPKTPTGKPAGLLGRCA